MVGKFTLVAFFGIWKAWVPMRKGKHRRLPWVAAYTGRFLSQGGSPSPHGFQESNDLNWSTDLDDLGVPSFWETFTWKIKMGFLLERQTLRQAPLAITQSRAMHPCYKFIIWSWTAEVSPPESGRPHVTMDPSAKIAENASAVAWICCTLLSWSWTAELSPPLVAVPHVTTDPSRRMNCRAIT